MLPSSANCVASPCSPSASPPSLLDRGRFPVAWLRSGAYSGSLAARSRGTADRPEVRRVGHADSAESSRAVSSSAGSVAASCIASGAALPIKPAAGPSAVDPEAQPGQPGPCGQEWPVLMHSSHLDGFLGRPLRLAGAGVAVVSCGVLLVGCGSLVGTSPASPEHTRRKQKRSHPREAVTWFKHHSTRPSITTDHPYQLD